MGCLHSGRVRPVPTLECYWPCDRAHGTFEARPRESVRVTVDGEEPEIVGIGFQTVGSRAWEQGAEVGACQPDVGTQVYDGFNLELQPFRDSVRLSASHLVQLEHISNAV